MQVYEEDELIPALVPEAGPLKSDHEDLERRVEDLIARFELLDKNRAKRLSKKLRKRLRQIKKGVADDARQVAVLALEIAFILPIELLWGVEDKLAEELKLEKARRNSKNLSPAERAHKMAGKLQELGRNKGALKKYATCVQLDPDNYDAHWQMAEILEDDG